MTGDLLQSWSSGGGEDEELLSGLLQRVKINDEGEESKAIPKRKSWEEEENWHIFWWDETNGELAKYRRLSRKARASCTYPKENGTLGRSGRTWQECRSLFCRN